MRGGRLEKFDVKAVPPGLPPMVELLRCVAAGYLAIFKRFSVVHAENLPPAGPAIIVANHVKAYDPVCLQVASPQRLIRFMQAREYYEHPSVHRLLKRLEVIPLNRNGNDTAGIRMALRALSRDGCLGIFPEGKISTDGDLHEARQGVALLALATNAAVIPAYIHGTRPYAGMVRDFFQFSRVTLYFGGPVALGDLYGRHRDPESRQIAVDRIMAAIAVLRHTNQCHPAHRAAANDPGPVDSPLAEGGK